MRLNRGTLALIAISLAVIIAVLIFNNSQRAAAPGTETAVEGGTETAAGPLFPGIDAASLVRFELRDNITGQRVVLSRPNTDDQWGADLNEGGETDEGEAQENTGVMEPVTDVPGIAESSAGSVDQAAVSASLADFAALAGVDSFEAENLADFGLEHPAYTAFAVGEDGSVFAMHIGSRNPNGTRYYAVVDQIGAGETTEDLDYLRPLLDRSDQVTTSIDQPLPDVTDESDAGNSTLDGGTTELDALAATMDALEGQPEQTEIAATYSAIIEATNAAADEATEEGDNADSEMASVNGEAGAANSDDANTTAEPGTDNEAEGTEMMPMMENPEVETSLDADETAAAGSADAAASPTVMVTAEAEGTLEAVAAPGITLEGPRTVLLVPQDALTALIGLIDTPPMIFPTQAPTDLPTANPFSEVDQTSTASAIIATVPVVRPPDATEIVTAEPSAP